MTSILVTARSIVISSWRVYSSQRQISPFLYDEYTRHSAKYCYLFMTSILITVRSIPIYSWRVYSSEHEVLLFLHDEYTRHNAKYRYFFITSILDTARNIISSWRIYSSQQKFAMSSFHLYYRARIKKLIFNMLNKFCCHRLHTRTHFS